MPGKNPPKAGSMVPSKILCWTFTLALINLHVCLGDPPSPAATSNLTTAEAEKTFEFLFDQTAKLQLRGLPENALHAARKCRDFAVLQFEPGGIQVALASQQLGSALLGVGRHADAFPILAESYSQLKALTGPDSSYSLSALNDLAVAVERSGEPEKAEGYYRNALAASLKVHGEQHTKTATIMHNLGTFLLANGRIIEADQLERAALRVRRQLLGKRHPLTIQSMNAVGLVGLSNQELTIAEPLIREAARLAQEELPADSPVVDQTLRSLAIIETAAGRIDQAIRHMQRAVSISEKNFGKSDKRVLEGKQILADMLASQGKIGEAKQIHAHIVADTKRAFGEDSDMFVAVLFEKVRFLERHNELKAAKDTLLQAIESTERNFGRQDHRTIRGIVALARIVSTDNPQRCVTLSREALAFYEANEPPNSIDTAATLNALGNCEKLLGNIAEAHRAFARSTEMLRRATGPTSLRTLAATLNLAQSHFDQNDLETADDTFTKGFDALTRSLTPDREQLAILYITFRSRLRRAQGRIAEAEEDEKFLAALRESE